MPKPAPRTPQQYVEVIVKTLAIFESRQFRFLAFLLGKFSHSSTSCFDLFRAAQSAITMSTAKSQGLLSTVSTGLLPNSDGSAQIVVGGTKVVCLVVGPIEPKPRQAMPNVASLEVVVRPLAGLSSTREKLLEDKLRGVLQRVIVRYQFPRQLIQIVVQFLTADEPEEYTGNELSAAINVCYYALIDANIPLYTSFASLSTALADSQTVENPDKKTLQKSTSHHVFCFSFSDNETNELLLVDSFGDFSESELFELISSLADRCKQLHVQQRKVLEAKLSQDYIWS